MGVIAAGSIALVVASFFHLPMASALGAKASLRFQQPAGWTFPDSNGMSNIFTCNPEESP